MNQRYPVALIEQNTELRLTLTSHFKNSPLLDCIISVDSIQRFNTLFHVIRPPELKVILLDGSLLNNRIPALISGLKKKKDDVKIVVLSTQQANEYVSHLMAKGICGFLNKDLAYPELESIIHTAIASDQPIICSSEHLHLFQGLDANLPLINNIKLTRAEYLTCSLLTNGYEYLAIAHEMGISLDGVRYHIRNIYRKMEVNSKWELIRKCRLQPPLGDNMLPQSSTEHNY
jgi:DNA-binding NarL/FixJ family response regulator